jgi:predicted dehydrogenase
MSRIRNSLPFLALACAAWTAGWSLHAQSVEVPRWALKDLRVGIIGTDTSHVPSFTKILHSRPEWKIRVVAAYKGGSPDLPLSATRVDKFAAAIQEEHGVEIVDSIDELLEKVDVVLLTSVDGRPHLAQVTPVFHARKRVFIDKPLAASLDDVHRIVALSRQTRTPFFSASSVRFHPEIPRLRNYPGVGKVTRVRASYLLNTIPFHPDLFFYGIHGVEALYAVMGRGCVTLERTIDEEADVTSCRWRDGRIGVYHGLPKANPAQPLLTVMGTDGVTSISGSGGSEGIVRAIAEFFHTGRSPVNVAETVEVFEFMTAAELSKERNGAPVSLAELRK